jgi:hypothetical protein
MDLIRSKHMLGFKTKKEGEGSLPSSTKKSKSGWETSLFGGVFSTLMRLPKASFSDPSWKYMLEDRASFDRHVTKKKYTVWVSDLEKLMGYALLCLKESDADEAAIKKDMELCYKIVERKVEARETEYGFMGKKEILTMEFLSFRGKYFRGVIYKYLIVPGHEYAKLFEALFPLLQFLDLEKPLPPESEEEEEGEGEGEGEGKASPDFKFFNPIGAGKEMQNVFDLMSWEGLSEEEAKEKAEAQVKRIGTYDKYNLIKEVEEKSNFGYQKYDMKSPLDALKSISVSKQSMAKTVGDKARSLSSFEEAQKNNLVRYLDIDLDSKPDMVRSLRNGNMDAAKIAGVLAGELSIYKKVIEDQKNIPFRVCLIGDESGSMGSAYKIELQKTMFKIFSGAFSEILTPDRLYIYGHSTYENHTGGSCEGVKLYKYHEPGDDITELTSKINRMRSRANNLDGFALQNIYEYIRKDTDDPVLMIYFSDGQPAGANYGGMEAMTDLKKISENCRRDNFIIFSIGLFCNHLDKMYHYSHNIEYPSKTSDSTISSYRNMVNHLADKDLKEIALTLNRIVKSNLTN